MQVILPMSQPTGPRVFISYSHDSPEHRERVLRFANRLRKDGVDAWIDQFDVHQPQPWMTWMEREIEQARKILMVFTPTYKKRFELNEEAGRGDGVKFEGIVIGQSIYQAGGRNEKFRAVLFEGCDFAGIAYDPDCISIRLRAYTHYRPETPLGYEELVRWIFDQPVAVPEEIGSPPAFLSRPATVVVPESHQIAAPGNTASSLPRLYLSRQSALREECKTIPVFGRLRPDIPMDQSFINLTLDARFREQERETQVPHFLDHEDADRRGAKERRRESANLPIRARTLWQTYSKGLIIGLPGAGKTTILRHFAHLAFSADPQSLVLFLPCRSLKPHHVGLGDGRPTGNRDLPTIFRRHPRLPRTVVSIRPRASRSVNW